MKPLFIAATGQHVGKTTSTLGLLSNILEKGINAGYCKPVGQKHVTVDGMIVDKDVALFSKVLGFEINPDLHSPVIIGKGVTKQYIDNPSDFSFTKKILQSAEILENQHQMVVYEGTGHPGVGSVVDASNADVAKMLNAGIVMIAEGGIGNTIDKLTLSIAQFRQHQVPILGVIVNKVLPDKIDQVQHYVGKKLKQFNLDLLGVLPFDKRLSFPLMGTIKRAIKGRVLYNEAKLNNQVENIIAGSLLDAEEFPSSQNMLLVVSFKRLNEAIGKIKTIMEINKLKKTPLSGIIITGDGRHEKRYTNTDICNDYIKHHQIPVITTDLDTYGSVVKISRIEVKINTKTPWKAQRAIELIRENVDINLVLNKLELLDSPEASGLIYMK